MKRIATVVAVALVVAACSDPASDGTVQPVSTSITPTTTVAPTTTIESTTTTTDAPTTTTPPAPTTTTTLAPLQALAYEQVATAGFPMALIPDLAGDRDLVLTRAGLVSDLATGEVVLGAAVTVVAVLVETGWTVPSEAVSLQAATTRTTATTAAIRCMSQTVCGSVENRKETPSNITHIQDAP